MEGEAMRRMAWAVMVLAPMITACDDDLVRVGSPDAPRAVDASYYDRAVYVTWELGTGWDGESFRIYARRETDPDYFSIAEVTNCSSGLCSYTDTNIVPGVTYLYYVAAVDPATGAETASDVAIEVFVPQPVPPPVPGGLEVIALDGATYLRWAPDSREAEDFSFYRVYLDDEEGALLLGETDSEGFLDELAQNGVTYAYFVSAVDDQGHESDGGLSRSATPRPDYQAEWVWDFFDRPELSGFRFQEDEETLPIVSGTSPDRHFRLETDASGWWLVPGPGTAIYPAGFETTTLRCGPGADAGCTSLDSAPTSGYTSQDVAVLPQTTYALRVPGDDGQDHYGAVRVTMLGFDQDDDAIMIFSWAYQLQPGNPQLAPRPSDSRGGG
jgi:hypothetical protein